MLRTRRKSPLRPVRQMRWQSSGAEYPGRLLSWRKDQLPQGLMGPNSTSWATRLHTLRLSESSPKMASSPIKMIGAPVISKDIAQVFNARWQGGLPHPQKWACARAPKGQQWPVCKRSALSFGKSPFLPRTSKRTRCRKAACSAPSQTRDVSPATLVMILVGSPRTCRYVLPAHALWIKAACPTARVNDCVNSLVEVVVASAGMITSLLAVPPGV